MKELLEKINLTVEIVLVDDQPNKNLYIAKYEGLTGYSYKSEIDAVVEVLNFYKKSHDKYLEVTESLRNVGRELRGTP